MTTTLPPLDPHLERLLEVSRHLRQVRADRDELILAARRAGLPLRAIAIYAEVSPQTVLNITKRIEGDDR